MVDTSSTQSANTGASTEADAFDLVVIGAGIAGLNALYAASEYLPKGARVLLLDQKDAPGGMWNTAYDYVRLHQPHPMFTVGDMKWDWRKSRDYLAARDEVQTHLVRSLGPVGSKVELHTGYGQTVTTCAEIDTPKGPMAQITYNANGDPSQPKTVLASRAIHAPGLNYALAEPLDLSSGSVHSIIPQDLGAALDAHPHAPVVVVGGGKTGMDTVLSTLAKAPQRHVSLVKGRGTVFFNRTKYVPMGLKRWTSGELVSRLFRELAYAFDGENEDDTVAYFRTNYSTDPASENGVFLYGLQSEEEHRQIKSGLAETYAGYLEDVIDTQGGLQLVLRSGATAPIPEGAIIVNCTGSFFRGEPAPDIVPILSPKGSILSINPRDGWHFLTSVSGFFTTHLWFRDQLRGRGFYTLDHEDLFRKNRNAWVGASAAQAYMNQVIAVQTLPMMLLDRCGLDLDRWYPLPRRLAGLIKMKSSAKADIDHCQKVLGRTADRFGLQSGALT